MRKNTTKKEYEEFKTEFLKYKFLFGLIDYDVNFEWGTAEEEDYANLSSDAPNRVADAAFCKVIPNGVEMNVEVAKSAGKHECIHLLFARARHLAMRRNLRQEEWDEEEEHIVRVLEKMI